MSQVPILSPGAYPKDEIIVEPDTKRIRLDDGDEENEDRLSDLPDCLILHILSFCNTVYAVRTCILSTRWKHLWKRLPILMLHSYDYLRLYSDFSTLKFFDKFVSKVISLRDDSIALRTFEFGRYGASVNEPHILNKVVSYVFSHSTQLQRLGLSVRGDSSLIFSCISSCRALTSLKLSVYPECGKAIFPNSLNFPALITLDLTYFSFCVSDNVSRAEPFSAFNSLNSLILCSCDVKYAQILSISSATLVNLTVNQLYSGKAKIELSAPSLSTFTFTGTPKLKLCGSTLSSVRQVTIDTSAHSAFGGPPFILLNWLQDLPNIKSLTVTSHTLVALSKIPDLFKVNFPSLCNLKSLKVKMERLQFEERRCLENFMFKNKSRKEASKLKKAIKAGLEPSPTILHRIAIFLLQNSPLAKLTSSS